MPELVSLPHYQIDMGNLTVIENLIPGNIRRVYFISDVPPDAVRGGHSHHKTWQALVCIKGSCRVFVDDNRIKQYVDLNDPHNCLLLAPSDWHQMMDFSDDAILLVLANEVYDVNDYIDQPYS